MKHTKLTATANRSSTAQVKDLRQRTTGAFYTPIWMAQRLARQLLRETHVPTGAVRVVDPFAGDGRLLVALVEQVAANKHFQELEWHFELWESNGDALTEAKTNLADAIRLASLKAIMRLQNRDSFLTSSKELASFDLVITNPPWESLKPDSRELRGLSKQERQNFVTRLRAYDKQLAVCLPYSQPMTKLYGWGTNLSRCGLELAVGLLRPNGFCGIVLPSSILADQVSAPLRKWMFQHTSMQSIDYYPAEVRPFEKVDQPCIFTIIQRVEHPSTVQPVISRHNREHKVVACERICLTTDELEGLEFRIPAELAVEELELLLKLSKFRPLSDWEVPQGGELWMGRELDETGYRSFVSSAGEIPFIKGRDVTRFAQIGPAKEFIGAERKGIPKSVQFQRVAWRDVSRRSQPRRMFATIIQPGIVTGNSLHVAYFRDGDIERLNALLGVINSMVFEFQLRSRLGTGHVSLGAVRRVRVPDLDDNKFVHKLSQLTQRALFGDSTAEIEIERSLADAFSLSTRERDTLISHFTGLSPEFSDKMRDSLKIGVKKQD